MPPVGTIGCYGLVRMGRVIPVAAVVCGVAPTGRLMIRLIGWEAIWPDEGWAALTDALFYRRDVPVSPILQVGGWTPGPPGTGDVVSEWYSETR